MKGFMAGFFVLFLLAVTWPGYLLFNRISPRILGLPLSFAWPALWIVAGFLVLIALDRVVSRAEDLDEEPRPEHLQPWRGDVSDGPP